MHQGHFYAKATTLAVTWHGPTTSQMQWAGQDTDKT